MRLLRELRANITPAEREKVGLPSSVLRILPGAEELTGREQPPVQVTRNRWTRLDSPERLVRVYEFQDPDKLRLFLDQVLEYQQDRGHHGELIVREAEVEISVWTHGLDQVTEIDIEYSRDVELIFKDVQLRDLTRTWTNF